MDLRDELVCQDIGRHLIEYFKVIKIDYDKIVQTNALNALEEIKRIIHNDTPDDFMMVDKIVDVFIKYNIDSGGCVSYLTEETGGTAYTVNYAKSKGLDVINAAE